MISWLKEVVLWLESRFPEKVTVTAESYRNLSVGLDRSERGITCAVASLAAHEGRLSSLETKSAHVDAVKDVIVHVAALKSEVAAMKAAMGWSQPGEATIKQQEIQAMLNGEVI